MNTVLQAKIEEGILQQVFVEPVSGIKLFSFSQNGQQVYIDRWHGLNTLIDAQNSFRLTEEELTLRLAALKKILLNRTVNEQQLRHDMYVIVDQLEAMSKQTSMASMMMQAAVMLVDETENPLIYDGEYAKEKVARWAKDPDVFPFVLALQPVNGLDLGLTSPEDTLNSLEELTSILKRSGIQNQVLQIVLSQYGGENLTSGQLKSLSWHQEIYSNLHESASLLLANTSTIDATTLPITGNE